MLNLSTKCIVLSCDVIWPNKTYGKYISRQEHTKAVSYILQDEDKSDKWYYVKIDTIKTEDVNIEQNVNTDQDYRREEDLQDVQKTTKTISFEKQ